MLKWGLGGTSADQGAAAVGEDEGEGADVQTGHGNVFLFEEMARADKEHTQKHDANSLV